MIKEKLCSMKRVQDNMKEFCKKIMINNSKVDKHPFPLKVHCES